MPTQLNKTAYNILVKQDIVWLLSQRRTLERDHIAEILRREVALPSFEMNTVRKLLLQIEQHCPCGARPETIQTHPHVIECPVAEALRHLEKP